MNSRRMPEDWTLGHMVTRVFGAALAAMAIVITLVGFTGPELLTAEYDDNGRRIVNVG